MPDRSGRSGRSGWGRPRIPGYCAGHDGRVAFSTRRGSLSGFPTCVAGEPLCGRRRPTYRRDMAEQHIQDAPETAAPSAARYPITDADVRFYREHGYLLVKGILDAGEAAAMRQECHDLLGRLNDTEDPTWGSAREAAAGTGTHTGATRLRHCHDTQFHSAAFARLLVDRRFTDTAAALNGSPNVQLHHTKMFVKPPENGSPFPMHQDHPFFPHAKDSVAAAIFHFSDASEEQGCVRVVPGSHREGPLEHIEDGSWHLSPDRWPLADAVPCPAEAGDVLFFTYLTVHGSGLNTSDQERVTWLVQYRDPEDRPTTDEHQWSLGQGMILRGVDPTGRRP
jgi:phytanoyl-CoA hydroxylase